MLYRMKVTALLPDQLIDEIRRFTKGKTLTESLMLALKEWLTFKKLAQLNEKIKKNPLQFKKGFTAEKIRTLNRK